MKINWPWKKEELEVSLRVIEGRLDAVLTPVSPRPEFISSLRGDLVGVPSKKKLPLSPTKIRNGILILGGVMSAMLVVMAGIRAVIALLGAIGIIQQVKKTANEKAPLRQESA